MPHRLTMLLVFCLSLLTGPAIAKSVAGYVIAAGDGVSATAQNGSQRTLSKRSPVFSMDTITTKSQSAQIRFTDGGLVSLRPFSSFKIENYHWSGKADGSEKGFFSLVKGGLRSVTGAIGKNQRSNYRMKTPVGTIGIRGTHYVLFYCIANCGTANSLNPKGLYGSVIVGGITYNGQNFGVNAYFFVPNTGGNARRLSIPPGFLLNAVGHNGIPTGLQTSDDLSAAVAAEMDELRASNPDINEQQLASIIITQLKEAGYSLGDAVAALRATGINRDIINNEAANGYGVSPQQASEAGDNAQQNQQLQRAKSRSKHSKQTRASNS